MKKSFVKVIAVVLAAAFLMGTAPVTLFARDLHFSKTYTAVKSKAYDSSTPGLADLLRFHDVFHTASGEGCEEYMIVHFGYESRYLQAITIHAKYDKSYGYTKDVLMSVDWDEAYPGFSTFSFADYEVEDDGEYINCIFKFKDLYDMDNVKKMADNGLIILEDEKADRIDADIFMQSLEDAGAEKMSMLDYSELGLDFDLD